MQIAHCSDVVGLRSNDRKSTIDYPDYNKARLCMVIHNAHAVLSANPVEAPGFVYQSVFRSGYQNH